MKDTSDDSPRPRLVRHVLPTEIWDLWDHYGRLRAYETVMEWAPIETIHSLRIEGKRLRYLLEFFAETLGPGLSGVIEALVGLQDHIGELHDVDVTIGLLREFLMRSSYASTNPAVADAVGQYLKLKQARLRTLTAHAEAAVEARRRQAAPDRALPGRCETVALGSPALERPRRADGCQVVLW